MRKEDLLDDYKEVIVAIPDKSLLDTFKNILQ